MLIKEINEGLSVNDLFAKLYEEFKSDLEALNEVNLTADGSVEWEAPTADEKAKFAKDKMVQQHGDTSTGARLKQLIANTPVPGDFVSVSDSVIGIIISLDQDKGVVTLIDKNKSQLGTFNIKDLKLTGKSTSVYKTVYTVFKNEIKNPLAPEDANVKRFVYTGQVDGQS